MGHFVTSDYDTEIGALQMSKQYLLSGKKRADTGSNLYICTEIWHVCYTTLGLLL